jgi:hypothetical protein
MSQRYSMGSSDPLLAGFEIRFGSLNFQAMGNDYLMRITNRAELHPWRSIGPGPVPATPVADAPAPAQADVAGPSAPQHRRRSGQRSRREWNDVEPRAPRHNATHPSATQRRRPQGSAWPPSRGSPTGCATPRQLMLLLLAPTWRHTRTFLATTF